MKNLHLKIEQRKRAINDKKFRLEKEFGAVKYRLANPTTLGLSALGGLLLGFLLMPKKYKLLKLALKGITLATTTKQLLNRIPHRPHKYRDQYHQE